MDPKTAHVPHPTLTFRDETPVSEAFGDVYFSRGGGIAETEHVFVRGNGLPQRFLEQPHFTIGELGFGTGLNFLVAWQTFLATAPSHHHLHYLSVEKYPLTPSMLTAALALQPSLAALAEQLIAAYPLRLPGWHRIHLPRVTLTLGFGDAEELLTSFSQKLRVDAWFLDGFAPAKNPDMWNNALLAAITELSAPQASFATFTAASAVRRGLIEHGFTVGKVPGYGRKREMLVGKKSAPNSRVASHGEPEGPEVSAPRSRTRSRSPSNSRSLLIIGGGIAGCTLARLAAERGIAVTLVERGEIASGASGNEAAVLFPPLPKRWTEPAAWYFAGYDFSLRTYTRWQSEGLAFPFAQPGMLRLPRHAEEEAVLREMESRLGLDSAIAHWIEQDEACEKTGVACPRGGAWFPQGSWLSPQVLCRALLEHPAITTHTHTVIEKLTRTATGWQATRHGGSHFTAQHCCITSAQESNALLPQYGLTLHAVGGQVSVFSAADAKTSLRSILCHKGYVIPAHGHYLIGATYDHDARLEVTAENHARNHAEVETFLPGWLHGDAMRGRVSLRATTPDRLPYVGALEDGLWISAGHGSSGMLSAPLAAEMIVSSICEVQLPLTLPLAAAVAPQRFKR